MTPLNPPLRFLLNQFLRTEISLPHVLLYTRIRVIAADEVGPIQVRFPQFHGSLFIDASMAEVLPRVYSRFNDADYDYIISSYVNIYWDRMEGR